MQVTSPALGRTNWEKKVITFFFVYVITLNSFHLYTSENIPFSWQQKDGSGKHLSHPESFASSFSNDVAVGWCEKKTAADAWPLGAPSALRPPAAQEEAAELQAGTGTVNGNKSQAGDRPAVQSASQGSQDGHQQVPFAGVFQRVQSPLPVPPETLSDAG